MTDLTFFALATVTVASAIIALEARDLIYDAAAIEISFLVIAGLFFLLVASYSGVFQIAVYIGAVVVLILFTVMLVGPQLGEPPLELKRLSLLTALLVSLLLGTAGSLTSAAAFPGPDNCSAGCDLTRLSASLINQYGVPLEFLSLVLAAAVIGALTLAKAERKG